jgi:hypothetical protein
VNPRAARLEAWRLALLDWMLDANQLGMYEFIFRCEREGKKRIVLNCSRRIGKTFLVSLIAIEYALKHPRAKIKFAASTADDLEEIILPIFEEILSSCPPELRPKWRASKQKYRFANGAEIKLAGCDDRRKANRLRGTAADLVVIEEAGSIPDLKYVVNSVLAPQLISTGGMMLFASTPPDSIGHEFVTIAEQAESVGAYLHRTIFDCPRYSKEQREDLFRQMAGKMPLEDFYKTEDFRREFLAELISDQNLAVLTYATLEYIGGDCVRAAPGVDRWKQEKEGIVTKRYAELARPFHFVPYEGGDHGVNPDLTGWLFAYWHFEAQTLVIERELLIGRMTTHAFHREAVALEKDWLGPGRVAPVQHGYQPPRRFADGPDQFFVDLAQIHDFPVHKTKKDDLKSAVNNANLMIPGFNGHLAVNPERCPELLRQMKAAIWDKHKKTFHRPPPTTGLGHYDLVAALVYLTRNVVQTENPVPPGWGFDPHRQFRAEEPGALHGTAGALKRLIFGRK